MNKLQVNRGQIGRKQKVKSAAKLAQDRWSADQHIRSADLFGLAASDPRTYTAGPQTDLVRNPVVRGSNIRSADRFLAPLSP